MSKKIFINSELFWSILKRFLVIYLAVLIPVYWCHYGPQNFLWLSDFGLFLTTIGLWLNSGLLISMAAVGVMAVELAWNVDYFIDIFFKVNLIHLSDYMFDCSYPVLLRGLSLFHVFTPIIWVLYLMQYGYNRRAIYYFTALYWASLIFIYFFTDPKENISWVFWSQVYSVNYISEPMWVVTLFICFPLLIFFPTHYIFTKLFKKA